MNENTWVVQDYNRSINDSYEKLQVRFSYYDTENCKTGHQIDNVYIPRDFANADVILIDLCKTIAQSFDEFYSEDIQINTMEVSNTV